MVVNVNEYEIEEQDLSFLIWAFKLVSTIRICEHRMLLCGAHDRKTSAHDVDSRVLGRSDLQREAGESRCPCDANI